MSIGVNIHRSFRHHTKGRATAEVNGNTVSQCLYGLVQQFPGIKPGLFDKKGKLINYVDIYVNQESSYPEELAKGLKINNLYTISVPGLIL